jgi:hypothetical protein
MLTDADGKLEEGPRLETAIPPEIAAVVETPEQRIEGACRKVIDLRQRPLVLLFYPGLAGTMMREDVNYCYRTFRQAGITLEKHLETCDVLIHTYGGDPISAYSLAHVIRDMAHHVTYLVPERAYSAGTLLCFSGDLIRMGHYAGLSPIDITLDESGREEVELTSIDYYQKFATDSQRKIQMVLQEFDEGLSTSVGSDLLCRMVEQVGALTVGKYYRTRSLTGHYAEELLDRYMLKGDSNAQGRRNRIIRKLLFSAPAHEYHIGYHICDEMGLKVERMTTEEHDATMALVDLLDGLVRDEVICQDVTNDLKMPFIAYFPKTGGGVSDAE